MKNMDFSFIRKVVKNISCSDAKLICQALQEKGIEVFVQIEDEFKNVTEDNRSKCNDLYVSAADLAFVKEYIKELGLEEYLCNETEINANIEKSEVEKAEEEFYRKHKQNQLFAMVIIVGVIILMIMQFFGK